MASAFSSRAFATHRLATTRLLATRIPSRHASTSVLYGISALSNRHETQYFSKLSRLPLMEHSPTLKLIHTSEVQRGDRSIPSSSARTRQPREEEHGDVEQGSVKQGNDDVQTEMNKQGDGPAYSKGQNKGTSSRRPEILPHHVKEHYESEIAYLEKQLLQSQEMVSELQKVDKRKEGEWENAARVMAQYIDKSNPLTRLFSLAVYVMFLLLVGNHLIDQLIEKDQARAIRELQSSIEDDLAEITSILEQAGSPAGNVADGGKKHYSGNEFAFQNLNDTDASSLEKPTRSWSSLLWKKH